MKKNILKIIIINTFLIYLFYSIFYTNRYVFAHPNDTIITNNNYINNQESLQDLSQEIKEDSLNYTFKKDEILNNLSSFKIEYINTINHLIYKKNFIAANNYLNKYFHLFENDPQVLALQKTINNKLSTNKSFMYTGDIEVLSFKPLIAYPESVFINKNSSSTKLDENHITIDEFSKILLNLYEKNYILISPKCLTMSNDLTKPQPLLLPRNKKPLILILEDVAYDSKLNGCVDRLLIDRNNKLSTYTPKRAINDRIHTDKDFITILESFVDTHPSFNHNGAKALIVVDGCRGIFGYNTQKTNATSKHEIKKAIEIINYLKNNGYTFASKGYNTNINESSVSFASGLNAWQNDVIPIIGDSNIFFLNTSIKNLNNSHSEHFKILHQFNYSLLIGSEMKSTFEYNDELNNFYLAAKPINGKSLRYSQDELSHLFDCSKIYDHMNRSIPYSS